MRPTPSIHDNFVYAYSVDCENRLIVLHTAFRDREPQEFTDVVFHKVIAHYLEHVLPGNILFNVEEADIAAMVQDNAQLLVDSWQYGWPPVEYKGDLKVLVATLKASSVRAYEIVSTLGRSGWVLAGSYERISSEGPSKVV